MAKRIRLALVTAAAALTCFCACRGDAAQPEEKGLAIDAFEYPDDAAARAAWQPMQDVAPVSLAEVAGRKALRMPCNFAGTKIDRGSWDRAVKLDLTRHDGIGFHVMCRNTSPIAHFSVYLQSGDGWYKGGFAVGAKDRWNAVSIHKEGMGTEGKPAGWANISTIRISAWRGGDDDTELFLADMRCLGGDSRIAVVRGESAATKAPGEMESVRIFAANVSQCLRDIGLPYSVVADLDLTPDLLKGKKLVILPHNPVIPDSAVETIAKFVEGGGKLIVFYALPGRLAAVMGIEGGDHIPQKQPGQFASIRFSDPPLPGAPAIVHQGSWNIRDSKAVAGRSRVAATWFDKDGNSTGRAALIVSDAGVYMTHVLMADDAAGKRRMMLAMAGHLVPEFWDVAVKEMVSRVGKFGAFESFEEARRGISAAAPGDEAVQKALDGAEKARAETGKLIEAGKFPDAASKAEDAKRLAIEAYCRAQSPVPGEHRAFWCHSAFGVAGMSWDEAIRKLKENGFTAVIPNMLWGGVAYYESSVLPVAPEIKEKGDQIAECVAACRKHGIQCHVWKVNWRMSNRTPKEFAERMKAAGRTQARFDGTADGEWLCPSHPENRKLEIAAMVEVATKYDVDGIHFDYIRYPWSDNCFCAGCRERFEKAAGVKVPKWPADVRADKDLQSKWLDFRRDNITAVVAGVSEEVRRTKPKVKISAAVFANWPVDRNAIGQDWKLWCDKGYLDFVCPMDYTPHDAEFESIVANQVRWAGKVPCYPGIGISCWSPACDVVRLIGKVAIARRLKTGGFTVFEYAPAEAREVLPLCGMGVTRPK